MVFDGGVSETQSPEAIPKAAEILAEFADRELCRHPALFYETAESQLAACAAFAVHELRRDRQFLYLYDDNDAEAIRSAFRIAGLDVERRIADGDLRIESAEEVYLDGEFEPERMIEALEDATEAALEAGYDGLSVAGENTWCFHTAMSFDHVLDFESRFDEAVPDLPITALCQYRLDRFDGESIGKALWTHEQIIYRGHVCDNPFYVPPAEFRDTEQAQSNGRLMLEQAHSLSQAQRDLQRREQRIEILNRTLRHNIRNQTNVVLGHLSDVLEGDRLHDADRNRIETAYRNTERIARTSEKARYVEATLSDGSSEVVDLADIVAAAVETVRRQHPETDVTTVVDGSHSVVVDTHFREAVDELLENAVRHQEASPPSVRVSVSESEKSIDLEVSNPGQPIPEDDRRALKTGRETPLFHGEGVGLWMVKWIVESSHARLRFPESDEECRVRIEVPKTSVIR